MEREKYNRVPCDYCIREEEPGEEHKVVNREDKFGKHADNITENEKLSNEDWNVEVTIDQNRKTDDDEKMDTDKETNEDETEEEDDNEEEEMNRG